MLFSPTTLLLSSLALASALPTHPLLPRSYTIIGSLFARDAQNVTYDVSGVVPDPSNPYGVEPIVGLTPYSSNNKYKPDYQLVNGSVRAGSDFGGQNWWIVPVGCNPAYVTGYLNQTSDVNGVGSTPGFTFNTSGHDHLEFSGVGFGGFWGCTGLQTGGNLVLEMEFGGVKPSDGSCKRVTVGKFAGLY
ncbi:hypothetical protein MMC13_004386 [Lambiella insularis]|nr:hypothetical protein [Lambiella insularis]